MPTEQSPQRQFLERQLRHFVRQFEGMGARITLLAQALDIPLGTASELSAVLQCDGLAAQRQAGREARMREELRGLLVLRYRVFRRLANDPDVGPQAARDILLYAHDRLLCKGFPREAPGMNLRALFDGLDD